jgi:hypothetical protein
VRQNYHTLRKKKNHLEEKLSIASEQRLVLIKEVKSLSSELDEVYGVYDSLVSMNIRLEEKTKDLQRYILRQFHENQQQQPAEVAKGPEGSVDELEVQQNLEGVNLEEEEEKVNMKQSSSSPHPSSSSPQVLLLSSDITHDLGDLSQQTFPSSLLTLFEETHHLLEASLELRMNKRDSFNVSDHRNSTRIIQEQSEVNENSGGPEDDLPSKNSLFGKMLSLDPSALLDTLRNPSSSASSSSSSNPNIPNTSTQSSGQLPPPASSTFLSM